MNLVTTYLFSAYKAVHETKWLRCLLYLFLIIKCWYWYLDFGLLFDQGNIIYKNSVHLSLLKSPAYFLFNCGSPTCATFVLAAVVLLSLTGIFLKKFSRIITFIIWFLVLNISNAVYPTLSGGDYLLQQLLFFNIFLSGMGEFKNENLAELDKAFHNLGVSAIKIQICIVYFISGLAKLMDADWQSGNAVSQIFMIHDFSLPCMYESLHEKSILLKLLTYFILAYQLSFPLLIWFKKIKKPFLLVGILMHLYIAFIMGLPTFGFIMIIAYSVFYFPKRNHL